MADVVLNIISVVSVMVTVYVGYLIIQLVKKNRPADTGNPLANQADDEDYARIRENVREIELNRQPNTGVHYDDENVYIKRGKAIKDSTSFFSLVNR